MGLVKIQPRFLRRGEIAEQDSGGFIGQAVLELGHVVPQLEAGVAADLPVTPGKVGFANERRGIVFYGVGQEAEATLSIYGIDDRLGILGVGGHVLLNVEGQVVAGLEIPLLVVDLFCHQEECIAVPAI